MARLLQLIERALSLLLQLPLSVFWLGWFALARRGAPLVFTHEADVDHDGWDGQMGALVAGLRRRRVRFVEVRVVPLRLRALRAALRRGRPFVAQSLLLFAGRVLAPLGGASTQVRTRARAVAAEFLLALLGTRRMFLVDELGSGQAWVRAGRRRGVRSVALQHGDFQPDNPQYAGRGPDAATRAADVLYVWSPWFQARLLANSQLYDAGNTVVVGRLRAVRERVERRVQQATRARVLLLLSEPGLAPELAAWLPALAAENGLELRVRPHPREAAGAWPAELCSADPLPTALAQADLVVGRGTSALLEALALGRPAVQLALGAAPDPSGYAREELFVSVASAEALLEQCRRPPEQLAMVARERVWGRPPGDPVVTVLDLELGPLPASQARSRSAA